MSKQVDKTKRRLQRQEEERRRDRRMRLLFWGTGAAFVLIIALAVIFQPKSKGLPIDYSSLPRLGEETAAVKIVEFGDFKCPTCKFFSEQLEPQIKKDYVDTGKAAFYFASFNIIDGSLAASYGGQAAFHQGNDKFWAYYDAVYKNQQDERANWATPEALIDIVKKENVPLDTDKLKADIDNATYKKEVEEQNALANKARLTGTPSLVINGKLYRGALDYASIKKAIDKALEDAK